jgi:hypothetical protein
MTKELKDDFILHNHRDDPTSQSIEASAQHLLAASTLICVPARLIRLPSMAKVTAPYLMTYGARYDPSEANSLPQVQMSVLFDLHRMADFRLRLALHEAETEQNYTVQIPQNMVLRAAYPVILPQTSSTFAATQMIRLVGLKDLLEVHVIPGPQFYREDLKTASDHKIAALSSVFGLIDKMMKQAFGWHERLLTKTE